MLPMIVVLASLVLYVVAYVTYGRWLSRRVFQLDPHAACPSQTLRDGHDYVPTPRAIVFGHHFTSIAGTGPIIGPAIAIFWGWVPALAWVLVGSIFIGAVHDLGALVVSMRNRGQTIGDIAGALISPRARLLFLAVLFLGLLLVTAVFGLVIANIFAQYPSTVFAIWIQIPIAMTAGWLLYTRRSRLAVVAPAALVLMYLTIWLGAYYLPFDLTAWGVPRTGAAAVAAGYSGYFNAVVVWTVVLLVYCWFASVWPVWLLLQPRDFVNANQLLLALGAIVVGLLTYPFEGRTLDFVAPAFNPAPPPDAPPMLPFLFITVACGAISGFHCLVASGTTSKQVARESDAHAIGFGSMLAEGALAVVVILLCGAALGNGVYQRDPATNLYQPVLSADGMPLQGVAAWQHYYSPQTWGGSLGRMVAAFVEGGGNVLTNVGVPITFGITVMAVLVACFASTTLDTAVRLHRYVIEALGGALGVRGLQNKYVATTVAVAGGASLALLAGPSGPGSGGMLLWPLFGAANQMLGGIAFLVIAFYLRRHRRPIWFLIAPLAVMIVMPAWALLHQMFGGETSWLAQRAWGLLAMGLVFQAIQVWILVEALAVWTRGAAWQSLAPPEPG